ncbi:MAG TPA: hypothetical protein VF768_06385, partial [Holophagaceae bacterium]
GGGVARLRGETWTRFGGSTGIPNWTVYALCEATGSDGHPWLWAGSLGSGIARLDLRNPVRWEVFTRDNLPGLTSNYVQRIERDREGRLYLSTSRGVVRFHAEGRVGAPTLGRVDSYTIGDGLPSMNGSLGASFLDAAGRIWIGTARGAAVLDPTLETLPGPPPAPVLEGATVDDSKRAVALGQRLGYRDSHLRFEFSLPVFHRKEDTRYQTQLVGLEAEPRPWQPEGWRDFATLPPGAYVLKVWGRTYDGRVSGPLVFPFSVAPPPWAHPAAYLLYALGVVGGALGLYRLRTRVLRERTLALEVAVNDRTRTIEHQSLQLEASNRALQGRNVELRETNDRNEQLIRELSSALAEVKTLQGLIPICSYCKKIRDDAGLWAQMEHYITEHSGAQFSHGICPECHGRFFSETQDPKPS